MIDLFAEPGPRVFSIAPHRPFLDDLARTLKHALSGAPFALSDATVLVPNRRAARALAMAFVRAGGEDAPATILPAIRALGDVDEDEPPFEPGEIALAAPPAISAARRRFELGSLLHARARAADPEADPSSVLPLADELGRLLDEAASVDGVDFAQVAEMYELLPAHLQQSAVFLEIVLKHWPQRLTELDRIDGGERRTVLMRALAQRWATEPPSAPVIAAGSTGSLTATRSVLAVIASLPRGAVVLPGVDVDLDDRAWESIDDGHPQWNLKHTLEELQVNRGDVVPWPTQDPDTLDDGVSVRARRRIVNEALRPASATDDWLARIANINAELGVDVASEGLKGLSLIEADSPDAEARAVALAVREALEDPGCDVMVTTPDLSLADRIAVALQRFGVKADVSAGRPLLETVPGAFLALVLALAREPGDPVALAALAKHHLMALGRPHRTTRIAFAEVEERALRGVRAGADLAAVVRKLGDEKATPDAVALVEQLDAALAPMSALRDAGTRPLAEFAVAWARAAETIATDNQDSGADRLWRDEAGEAAAALVRELMEESEAFPPVSLDGFARIYERLARARAVRRRAEDAPRVRILGPLEARLQSAGLVIAAGLNEGIWPAHPGDDPFLSRGMREAAGLPRPEQRLSLAAHDFAQLACAPRVLLSRAVRDDAGPTVASRWLWRLQTLARGAQASGDAMRPRYDFSRIAEALDRVAPQDARPVDRPAARPPISARPRRLSASRVREWVRDPYGLYARRVLKLRPLDPLDRRPGPLERGTAIHDALHALVHTHRDDWPADAADQLAAMAIERLEASGFGAAEMVAEAPRMRRAAVWFADWERRRRDAGWRPRHLETEGEASFEAPAGPFSVYAIADRIDVGPKGAAILDYKTGLAPSEKAARIGLEPQLGVEAVIMALGGFPDLPAAPPVELRFVRPKGGRLVGDESELFAKGDVSVADHAAATLEGLQRRAKSFDDPDTAYRARVLVQKTTDALDFDRLARVKEWATPSEDGA